MVARNSILESLQRALKRNPVVLLSGPRQAGKTTLAREIVSEDSLNYFDLEDPASLARLDEPMAALRHLRGIVVIDEVQRRPELFPTLRVLSDRKDNAAKFLILGSASGDLLRQSSESLAGRLENIVIGGFNLQEIETSNLPSLWRRGGFPLSFLAKSEEDSFSWRTQFIATLLERDFPQWGVRISATALRRFWTMVAHYHGQTWNAAEPARALGVSEPTARNYLDLLTDAFMIRQLQPLHANLKKRQVKAPKIYVRDSGILHQLLGISREKELHEHPKLGASWEGFVIEQLLMAEPHEDASFWSTYQGAEIDLVFRRGTKRFGIECKWSDVPKITRSIKIAIDDLGLDRVAVIYPGKKRFPLSEQVEAVPATAISAPGSLFQD